MDITEEDGHYQWMFKWGEGNKCWNGPVWSAEVLVMTCGADAKLFTTDEPETCRYMFVFTKESPIGCDEQFKVKHSF